MIENVNINCVTGEVTELPYTDAERQILADAIAAISAEEEAARVALQQRASDYATFLAWMRTPYSDDAEQLAAVARVLRIDG